MAQGGPKDVCTSSDQAICGLFGACFGRVWRLKQRQKKNMILDLLLGSKFGRILIDFGTKFEVNENDTLQQALKCAKSMF